MRTWITGNGYKITRILSGRSNVFLLSGGEIDILIDTGGSGDRKRLFKRLRQTGPPGAVIMTHTHFDHAGNAGMLKDEFSPVFLVQKSEQKFLESGSSPIPKGISHWAKFLYNLGAERVPQWFMVQGVKGDIAFGDRYDLSEFGINGFILHTPGHSEGSSCVIVDDEIALAGDAMVGMPMSIMPPWGDDSTSILMSWNKLLETNCQTFLPSHGSSIDRTRFEHAYLKLVTSKK